MLRAMRFTSSSSPARHLLVILSVLTIGAVVLRGAQGPAPAPARAAMYTKAQATTGESLYRQSCAGCHGATLTGGTAPPPAGPAFETSWSGPRGTAADGFFIPRTAMPPRAAHPLTAQDPAARFPSTPKMKR